MLSRLIPALALAVPLASGGAAPASAQRTDLPTELVEMLTARARAALPMARLEDGSNVPPETGAERSRPIVPRSLEIQTIERGILTGQMEACGLDWRNLSYMPYMRALRSRYRGKPMAYMGVLHGVTQGMAADTLAEQGETCTDAMRARLTAEAASRAIEMP
jgi:hypothetical protein